MKINAHEIVKTFPDYIVWGDQKDMEIYRDDDYHLENYVFPFHRFSDKDKLFLLRLVHATSASLALPRGLSCGSLRYGKFGVKSITVRIESMMLARNGSGDGSGDAFDNPYIKEAGLDFAHLFALYALGYYVSAELNDDLITIKTLRARIDVSRSRGFVSKEKISGITLDSVIDFDEDLGKISEFHHGVTFADLVGGDKDVAAEYLASALSAHVRVVELLAAQIQKLIDLHTRLELVK